MIKEFLLRIGDRLIKLSSIPFLLLAGYKNHKIGCCVVFAPEKQMHAILAGFDKLQKIDCNLFSELTSSRKCIFWYKDKTSYLRCGDTFAITDDYLVWGSDGVVMALVQCFMEPAIQFPPKNEAIARRQIQGRVSNWAKDKPICDDLISQYKIFTNKQ